VSTAEAGDEAEVQRLERQVRALESQLREVRQREAIGVFAAGLAHEFNNVLAAILGSLQLAELELAEESPARTQVARALAAGRRARDLVARMQALGGRPGARRKLVGLRAVVMAVAARLREIVPVGVEVACVPPASEALVWGDAGELEQALFQGGLNGAQAIGAGPGRIELSIRRGPPAAADYERHPTLHAGLGVCLGVRDSGGGLSAEAEENLFMPFFTTRRPGQGLGLGLPAVRAIVHRHQGVVVAENFPGLGTHVRLFLPAAAVGPSQEPGS